MKSIYKPLVAALALMGSLTSCSDFLTVDPVDKLTQDNFYTSDDRVRLNTATLYASATWDQFSHDFQWKFDMLSGDMFYTYSAEGQWYFGTYTSVNQYINQGWEGLYNVIAFANSIIHDMPGKCQSGVSEAAILQAQAEARCVRAYCYYLLTEAWTNVPVVENNSENITSNNLQLPPATQKSIYEFILKDLNFAVENLPMSDKDNFRATRLTALAIRAKVELTMASHTDMGFDRQALYTAAANDAKTVIDNKPAITEIDYSTLFDVEANNGPESLLAIQCGVLGYSYGNGRNCAWSRSSVIADQTWGASKGPTISLQSLYDDRDQRRQWVYMTLDDYYPNLNKANGGYTYKFINRGDDGSIVEDKNEMLAHIKKYVIGKSADCDGNVGLNQDAANNIYLLRLADMYFVRAEAIMGTADQTSDPVALDMVNQVRHRAGLWTDLTSLTYEQLLQERRVEFAFEGINWFDILRYRYRSGDQKAIDFLNSGWGTGYNRSAMYVQKEGTSTSNENNRSQYTIADNKADWAQYDPIMISTEAFRLPIPAAASTTSPQLLGTPVDYVSPYED